MGCNIWADIAPWTSLCLVLVLSGVAAAEHGLLQDLGLNILPDISKINISLDEYTRMMGSYLQTRENSGNTDTSIPKLITFNIEKQIWRKSDVSLRLKFPVTATHQVGVESAQLRILAAPQAQGPTTVRVQVNQVLGARRKKLVEERTFYLSRNLTKWCEMDVTSAVQSWLGGDVNLGLELVCLDCESKFSPHQAAITSLIYPEDDRRVRRSAPHQSERRTDCQKGKRKRKCCRQNMKVNFTKLEFPEINFIVEPKVYEAGYCHGLCPPNYNHATNHSRIQSLMHQMERKNAKIANRKIIPKACCAPSKLGPLEILLINKDDPSKLLLEKWDNMIVIECACS